MALLYGRAGRLTALFGGFPARAEAMHNLSTRNFPPAPAGPATAPAGPAATAAPAAPRAKKLPAKPPPPQSAAASRRRRRKRTHTRKRAAQAAERAAQVAGYYRRRRAIAGGALAPAALAEEPQVVAYYGARGPVTQNTTHTTSPALAESDGSDATVELPDSDEHRPASLEGSLVERAAIFVKNI